MLSRIYNSLAGAINKTKSGILHRYVIVVLDDDLISYFNFAQEGLATLLGTWLEWLAEQLDKTIEDGKKQVPLKSKKLDTFFYWVNASLHLAFSRSRNNLCTKFNLALDSVIRGKKNMRVIRLKEHWSDNPSLVVNDRITESGMTAYWDAIDASF